MHPTFEFLDNRPLRDSLEMEVVRRMFETRFQPSFPAKRFCRSDVLVRRILSWFDIE